MSVTMTMPRGEGTAHELLEDLEAVVRELLDHVQEPLNVRFGAWREEDGRLVYFCKVESPPADTFSLQPQWRWWSPLVDSPEALRTALREAIARRGRSAGSAVAPALAHPATAN